MVDILGSSADMQCSNNRVKFDKCGFLFETYSYLMFGHMYIIILSCFHFSTFGL
jgi:hypothetical protein